MSPIEREYFRVPRQDGGVYTRPAAADLAALVERNRLLLASYAFDLAGRPVQEFRAAARAELAGLARRTTKRWGLAAAAWRKDAPLIVTGHQPQPFHPGVWMKNFLAGRLAQAVGGAAVNLVVDNDAAHGHVLRFPERAAAGSGTDEIRLSEVALAPPAGGAAFEEEPSERLRAAAFDEALRHVPPPCADPLRRWAAAIEAAAPAAASLGEALSIARRRVEEESGLRNLELPVSALADTESFRFFVAWMLDGHESVHAAYNGALAEYRRAYRERSAAQPVPDLGRDGRRVELPLWIWRAGGRRRRMWVEAQGDPEPRARASQAARPAAMVLLADGEAVATFSAAEVGDARVLAARLAGLRRAGWRIRPRALAMTLFARLALGDVFVHGLGGALYDKVADAMFERLWGVRPPETTLASCTVHLPLEAYPATPGDLERARRRVRDWRFNPDRLLPEPARGRPEFGALAGEKGRLIAQMPALRRDERHRAYLRTHEINAVLAALDPSGPPAARADLERIVRWLRYNAVLRNREYAVWLYPPEELAAFYVGAATVRER
ncbi:MAG: hypothetical protein FJ288_01905 [Planctomycetes bacterium]|nr:hypothetical protein [Planctomycetota bacterium]